MHARTCTECALEQSAAHSWGDWYESEGETRSHDCGVCGLTESEADTLRGTVVAALLRGGTYLPYYALQSALDEAQNETVYLVVGVTQISETLLIRKDTTFGAVERTIGEGGRAIYTPVGSQVTLQRAGWFDGALLRVGAGASLTMSNVRIEGGSSSAPAIEVYGALYLRDGAINADCAIRLCAPTIRAISTRAAGGDAFLAATGRPRLGAIALDNPAGGVVPQVDLDGFRGTVTLRIADDRPYGAFASGIGSAANVYVEGGSRQESGLSRREVRLQDGMFLCGGYDLTAQQTALGEIVISGQCDPYLNSLSVTVNGEAYTLSASAGALEQRAVQTGSAAAAEIGAGGASTQFGLVSFDETTGRLIAPAGSSFTVEGTTYPLDAADPLALALSGDSATVVVDGARRTLDFSQPVGAAFVYRYLTEDGNPFVAVDYTNYERILEAKAIFDAMTDRQKAAVGARLAGMPYDSFEALVLAADDYAAEQSEKSEEFLGENEALSKPFDEVTGADRDALTAGLDAYFAASEEERHFLDAAAQAEGYSGFEGMVDDALAKTDFESAREKTVDDLTGILRGCDGVKVREELSIAIETVESAVYERCTDDDLRLSYLLGQVESLEAAVRALETIRAAERVRNAFDAYLTEKQESGCYSAAALSQMRDEVSAFSARLSAVDPKDPAGGETVERIRVEGMDRLNAVRADTVVSGFGTPESVLAASYTDEISLFYGYLTREEGFRGDCTLALTPLPAEDGPGKGLTLFGVLVQLSGDDSSAPARVCLLLPQEARGYAGYRVVAQSADGATQTLAAEARGDVLWFEAFGASAYFVTVQRAGNLVWLIVLLSCLCGLELVALVYVLYYRFRSLFVLLSLLAPLLPALIALSGSVVWISAALGLLWAAETILLGGFLHGIRAR